MTVPALTVNRVCGSGERRRSWALRQRSPSGMNGYRHRGGGGMENMDRAPYLMDGGRWGYRMGPAQVHDSMLTDGLNDAFSGQHSGLA